MVIELRHPRHFDAFDDPVANADLGIRIGLTKRQREGAEAEIDIVYGAAVKVARERPIARANQQHRVDRNQ